jgi:hypothetical protein
MIGLNQSLQGVVIGILRIGVRIYGLDLRRSRLEVLSDI